MVFYSRCCIKKNTPQWQQQIPTLTFVSPYLYVLPRIVTVKTTISTLNFAMLFTRKYLAQKKESSLKETSYPSSSASPRLFSWLPQGSIVCSFPLFSLFPGVWVPPPSFWELCLRSCPALLPSSPQGAQHLSPSDTPQCWPWGCTDKGGEISMPPPGAAFSSFSPPQCPTTVMGSSFQLWFLGSTGARLLFSPQLSNDLLFSCYPPVLQLIG